jgi:hypothetical protein
MTRSGRSKRTTKLAGNQHGLLRIYIHGPLMYATLFIACWSSGYHAARVLAQTDAIVRSRRTQQSVKACLAASYVVIDGVIDAGGAATALDELTNKSLISPDHSADEGSYRLLEMTRAYARKKLLERGDEEINATARRRATFYSGELETLRVQQRNFIQE